MGRRGLLHPLVLLAALTVATCANDEMTSPPSPEPSLAVSNRSGEFGRIDAVRALARALADEQVRTDLRDAMRASPLTEHKLIFQHYLATPAGVYWIENAAKRVGVSPGAIRSAFAQLPEMDLYLPYRDHRLTWRATADVALALVMDADAQVYQAFHTDGSVSTYDVKDGAPERAILVIHPAEAKGRRIRPQQAGPGEVVQDPDDGEVSARITLVNHQTGETTTIDFADLEMSEIGTEGAALMTATPAKLPPPPGECDPTDDRCEDQPPPPQYTKLEYFKIFFSDGLGSAEIEYRATKYNSAGSPVASMTYRHEGVHKSVAYFPDATLIFAHIKPGTNERIRVKLVETDFASDDYKGEATIYDGDSNVLLHTVTEAGEDCYWIDYNGNGLIDHHLGEWICDEVPPEVTSEFKVYWPYY